MSDTDKSNENDQKRGAGCPDPLGLALPKIEIDKYCGPADASSRLTDPDATSTATGTSADRSGIRSQSSASSTSSGLSNLLKKRILEKLGIKDISDFDVSDTESLNYFLQITLEQERKDVEKLREANLNKLDFIIDKCSASKALTSDSINAIFDIFSNRKYYAERERRVPESRPVSPEKKRKILESPVMASATGQKTAVNVPREPQSHYMPPGQGHRQPQSHLQPPLLSPYTAQYHGTPSSSAWLPQQFGVQGHVPAGLGSQARSPESGSGMASREGVLANPQTSPQNVPPGMRSGVQSLVYPPAGQVYPGAGPYFMPPAQGRRPAFMMAPQQASQESPALGVPSYFQASPNIQPPSRVRGDTSSVRRQAGHRRSHSSIIPSSNYTGLSGSPVRELQATPQKPVNFLIHTPKYPPPT